MLHTIQRFRVPDQKIPAWLQSLLEAAHDFLLCCLIEIDHYVPAKDHIERPIHLERFD
jgi:hypothetical protein